MLEAPFLSVDDVAAIMARTREIAFASLRRSIAFHDKQADMWERARPQRGAAARAAGHRREAARIRNLLPEK